MEAFSEMSLSLNQSQMAKDEVTNLIKDVRSFVEHIIIEEQKNKQHSLMDQGKAIYIRLTNLDSNIILASPGVQGGLCNPNCWDFRISG